MTTATTAPATCVAKEPADSRVGSLLAGFSAAVTTLVVIGAVLLVALAVTSRFSSHGKFVVLGHPTFVVLSGSMTPAVRTGDLIVDEPVSAAQAARLQPGRIITFRTSNGMVLTHRIAAIVAQPGGGVAYRTKGDANNAADLGTIAPSQIEGTFRSRLPAAGYLLNAMHRPMTLALLLAAPLLWMTSGALLRRSRRHSGRSGSIATQD